MSFYRVQKITGSLVIAVGLAGAITGVQAADILYEAPQEEYNWTGVYLGVDVGAGRTKNKIGVTGFGGIGTQSGGMLRGSIIAGFNYQVSPNFVVGVQADFARSISDAKETFSGVPVSFTDGGPKSEASVSARVGWLVDPNSMLYVLGGYSAAKYKVDSSSTIAALVGQFSETHKGVHVGVGIEWKMTPHVSTRMEYRYTQYKRKKWGAAGAIKVKPKTSVVTIGAAYTW